jgi:hypothetical protein
MLLGMRTWLLHFGLLGSLTGCATAAAPAPKQPKTAQPAAATAAEDLRALPPDATFDDLVRATRNLDQASTTQSTEGCLLRGQAPARLSADLLLSLKPLPTPPETIGEWVEGDPGVPTVLTAWDRVPGTSPLTLAAFTTTTAAAVQGKPVVLIMTRRGTYLRTQASSLAQRTGLLAHQAVGGWLAQLTASDTTSVYVTAEARVPLADLRALLQSIPDRFEVALAVTLPKGTQLPPDAPPSQELLCPDGLPEPAEGVPEGDIDGVALRDAMQPLREAALSCAQSTGGRAALGGRLVLALRVGADGRTAHACFVEDEVHDAMLRRCLASSAHSLALPKPAPAGFVDVALPLHIDLVGLSKQRAVCE